MSRGHPRTGIHALIHAFMNLHAQVYMLSWTFVHAGIHAVVELRARVNITFGHPWTGIVTWRLKDLRAQVYILSWTSMNMYTRSLMGLREQVYMKSHCLRELRAGKVGPSIKSGLNHGPLVGCHIKGNVQMSSQFSCLSEQTQRGCMQHKDLFYNVN